MKIRTRITFISCAAVIAASLLTDAVIWMLTKRSFWNEAFVKAYQNSYLIADDFSKALDSGGNVEDEEVFLNYYFKTQWDDYNIAVRQVYTEGETQPKEIYNHTVFEVKELVELDYKPYDLLDYAYVRYEGKHYLVFKKELKDQICFYRFEDISYVWDKMEWLTVCMLMITLVVAAATLIVMAVILKRVLRPLQELNDTTKHMAAGQYDQRFQVKRQDEIGELQESFNRMAEAVETRTKSLEESEAKKTLFMGNLTHELKTPMTAISGYAQTLLSVKLSEEQQEEALSYIYEECTRLERLSKKMMKLLELDRDSELEFSDTPVKVIFDAAAKSCGRTLRERQMKLEITEHGERFPMDADLMTDVVINLLDNAIWASGKGGRILLKAYGACIEVQDFGRGIPKDEQDKILEPFYMIDKSRSRRKGGAGLGLALTATIAKRHNVTLAIESEEGKGTRMILQFV